MKTSPKILIALLLGAVTVTQFNNCSNYADPADYTDMSSSISCQDVDCISANSNNLNVKANLGGNGAEYSVPFNLTEWNIGGDCNEGGFPVNLIRWELKLNGVTVRNSGMGILGPGQSANGRCVNGRFLLYINLGSIGEDPVNRTGLNTGNGVRAQYDLVIEIYGQTSPSDTLQRGPRGRMQIALLPI